jgi:hypothetical protein
MKKYLFLLLAICITQFIALNVSASNPNANSCLDVVAYSTVTDVSGNVYVTGTFCSPFITFGTTTLTNQTNAAGYYGDMFIVKYDAYGTVQWAGSAGGSNSEGGSSIATDGSGNVYVTGTFNSPSITFFGTTSQTITLINTASLRGDMFIVKYDANGVLQWAKKEGGSNEDEGIGIATDGSGNVYVTGLFTSSSINFEGFIITNAGSGNGDIFVVKYDPSGTVLWAKSAGGSGDDWGNSITTDGSGNVYVTGLFISSSITFGNTILYNAGTSSQDIFIVKYEPTSGNVVWAKRAGGSDNDHANGVITDIDGNVYVTGGFASPSITFGGIILANAASGSNDMFIVKYDPSGTVLWAKKAGGSFQDNGWGIAAQGTEGSDNVFVTGAFSSPSITFGNITLTNNHKSTDIFIVKYKASDGTVQWAKCAGGTGTDIAWGIATDGDGNAYLTGYFTSTSITFGTITLSNNSKWADMFITKYNADGNVPWAKCVSGISGQTTHKSTNAGIDNTTANEITVYPNPTSGRVIVSTNNSQSLINNISVFDLTGKEVLSRQSAVGSQQIEIDLSTLPKGIYIFSIKAGENYYNRKIIVE